MISLKIKKVAILLPVFLAVSLLAGIVPVVSQKARAQSYQAGITVQPFYSGRAFYDVTAANGDKYIFVPQEFVDKGFVQDGEQNYEQAFLQPGAFDKATKYTLPSDQGLTDAAKSIYKNPREGLLWRAADFAWLNTDDFAFTGYDASFGTIQGIGLRNGQNVYIKTPIGGATYGWIDSNGTPHDVTVSAIALQGSGAAQVPNSTIAPDSSIVGGQNQTNHALTGLSVSTYANGGFSSSFHEKYFSSLISRSIMDNCPRSTYSRGVLVLMQSAKQVGDDLSTPGDIPCWPSLPLTTQDIYSATSYSLGGVVTRYYDTQNALSLGEVDKTYRVESIENNPNNVRVFTESRGIAEDYGLRLSMRGVIASVVNGNYTPVPTCWEVDGTTACSPNPYTPLYKDGKTYLIDWDLGGITLQLIQTASVVSPTQIVPDPIHPDHIYPRNSNIVQVAQFYEQSYESGGWFSNPKQHWYYYSYGLSADGRTGTAYKEEWNRAGNSDFSDIAGPLAIAASIAIGFSDGGTLAVLFAESGGVGAAAGAIGLGDIAFTVGSNVAVGALNTAVGAFGVQTILQSNIVDKVKVENSDAQIGVGPWTWSKLLVSAPQAAPSCSKFTATPSVIKSGDSSELSWDCSNADSCSISSNEDKSPGLTNSFNPTIISAKTVSPTRLSTYALTCTGASGTLPYSTSTAIFVTAPATSVAPSLTNPAITLTRSPATLNKGGSNMFYDYTASNTNPDGLSVSCAAKTGTSYNLSNLPLQNPSTNKDLSWQYLWDNGWRGHYDCAWTASGPGGTFTGINGVPNQLDSFDINPPPLDLDNGPAVPNSVFASVTFNGQHNISLNDNGMITLAWSSQNGTSYSARYNSVGANCVNKVADAQWDWVTDSNFTSGGAGPLSMGTNWSGCTITVTFKVFGSGGSAESKAAVTMIPLGSALPAATTPATSATPATCQDFAANNVGWPLPCTYTTPTPVVPPAPAPAPTCQDSTANNVGGPLPCTYTSPVCTFWATPPTIIPPQSSSLDWRCSNANTCSIDNGIGSVNKNRGPYSKPLSPAATTRYTLSCNGNGGTSASFQTTLRVTDFNPKEIVP